MSVGFRGRKQGRTSAVGWGVPEHSKGGEHREQAPLGEKCKFRMAPGGCDPELQAKELRLNSAPVKGGEGTPGATTFSADPLLGFPAAV